MKINANIPALQTARHLNRTNDKIQSSLEKLSTGYKINKVSDDPTGTAVASKIKAQLYGLRLASRNALDGVSLVQTAEGAMTEVHEMLKRMRELSVQAANDTNSADDRNKIQMEIDQLIEAIDQTADITEFNKMKLLNGSLSNLTTIKEDDSSGEISYDLSVKYMSSNFPTGEYGIEINALFETASITAEFTGPGKLTLNGDTIEILETDTDEVIRNKINELANRYNCVVEDFDDWPDAFTITSKEAGANVSLNLSGTSVDGPYSATGKDAEVTLTGFSAAAVAKIEGNRITVTESSGSVIQIDLTGRVDEYNKYYINIEDKGQLKLQIGANEEQRISVMIPGLSSASLGLTKQSFAPGGGDNSYINLVNVKNVEGSQRSLNLLDDSIEKVSMMRATLGAYQNRLEHTVNSLDINATNTEESLSRIQDTDMALEMSQYSLNNVISQSAIAMLSQANERPQQLLQLLK